MPKEKKRAKQPARPQKSNGKSRRKGTFFEHRTVDEIAAEQGIGAITRLEDLLGQGKDLWGSDEEFDRFVAGIYERRRQSVGRTSDDAPKAGRGAAPSTKKSASLTERKERDFFRTRTADEVADEQGIAPVTDPDAVIGQLADLWASDEELERFVSDIYARRHHGRQA